VIIYLWDVRSVLHDVFILWGDDMGTTTNVRLANETIATLGGVTRGSLIRALAIVAINPHAHIMIKRGDQMWRDAYSVPTNRSGSLVTIGNYSNGDFQGLEDREKRAIAWVSVNGSSLSDPNPSL
jgi:hypothetical protein